MSPRGEILSAKALADDKNFSLQQMNDVRGQMNPDGGSKLLAYRAHGAVSPYCRRR